MACRRLPQAVRTSMMTPPVGTAANPAAATSLRNCRRRLTGACVGGWSRRLRLAPPHALVPTAFCCCRGGRKYGGRSSGSSAAARRQRDAVARPRAGPIPEAPAERITVHMTPTAMGLDARAPPRMHAARGHERNAAYMNDFEEGYAALMDARGDGGAAGDAAGPSRAASRGRGRGRGHGRGRGRDHGHGSGAGSGAGAAAGRGLGIAGRRAGGPVVRATSGGPRPAAGRRAGFGPVDDTVVRAYVDTLHKQWYRGPVDPSGTLVELSGRPLLCMSVAPQVDEVVVGGSDHALYTFNLSTGRKRRTLYTKSQGHSEWVTCVAHVGADGSGGIVSGGMDSKLCLWNKYVPSSRTAWPLPPLFNFRVCVCFWASPELASDAGTSSDTLGPCRAWAPLAAALKSSVVATTAPCEFGTPGAF